MLRYWVGEYKVPEDGKYAKWPGHSRYPGNKRYANVCAPWRIGNSRLLLNYKFNNRYLLSFARVSIIDSIHVYTHTTGHVNLIPTENFTVHMVLNDSVKRYPVHREIVRIHTEMINFTKKKNK